MKPKHQPRDRCSILIFTNCSPIIWVSQYRELRLRESKVDQDKSLVPVCLTMVDTTATVVFFLLLVLLFYLVPLLILSVLYAVIVKHLMPDPSSAGNTSDSYHARAKRHVITLLMSVVGSFFVCLTPYRILIFFIIVAAPEQIAAIDRDTFFTLLNFSRIMFYLHSALDPILYNLMSSKFRKSFAKLFRLTVCRSDGFKSMFSGTRRTDSTEQEENFV